MLLITSRVSHPRRLDWLVKAARYLEVDAVLLCGDVSVGESVISELSRYNVLAISGDEDDIYVAKLIRKYGILIDGRVVEISGLRVAGIGAMNTSLDCMTLSSASGKVDILLTHYPPYGCLDSVAPLYVASGLKSVRTLIETLKPSVVFVGHPAKQAVSYCGSSVIVGVAGYMVLMDPFKSWRVRFIPLT